MKTCPWRRLAFSIVWAEVEHFVAEHSQATWLQAHHRRSGLDRGFEVVQDIAEKLVGVIEKSIVIERPSAAKRRARHYNAKSGILQDLCGRGRYARMKVVIERIGPENDLGLALVARSSFSEPLFKRCGREFRQIALRRNAGEAFGPRQLRHRRWRCGERNDARRAQR